MKKVLVLAVVLLGIYLVLPISMKRGIVHNFANVDDYKLFPYNTVKTGIPQPWSESATYNSVKPSASLLEKIEANRTIAFLVIQNDSLCFEQYWKGYSDSSYSGSFSMAKSLISLLVGVALGEGKIQSLDQPIAAFIPEFKRSGTDTITIRELLSMSGGFNWNESYWNIFGKTARSYYGDQLNELTGKLRSRDPAGVHFRYASCETQMLGWMLVNIYKKSLAELASEKIWKKIGAEYDAIWSTDKAGGVEKSFCCFNSNARDFARLGKLVLQQGRWDSLQIVPMNYIKEATSPAEWLKDDEGNQVDFYGYQFWITKRKGLTIPYFRGVLGQFVFVIPEKNAIIVRLGEYVSKEREHYTPPDVFTYLDAGLEVLD